MAGNMKSASSFLMAAKYTFFSEHMQNYNCVLCLSKSEPSTKQENSTCSTLVTREDEITNYWYLCYTCGKGFTHVTQPGSQHDNLVPAGYKPNECKLCRQR